MTFENSPSKVADADQPFIQFICTDAVVSAESVASAAPLGSLSQPEHDSVRPSSWTSEAPI
ncbi:hypothetical protein JQ612_32460 [Bradyrhizobium manausense]|nr:hypothetical protein [Bradyrhizobium manausense]